MRDAAFRGSHDPELAVALAEPPEEADERPERGRVEERDGLQVDDHDPGALLLDEARAGRRGARAR